MLRLPPEPVLVKCGLVVYPVENGLIVSCTAGIFLTEIHCEGGCRAHIEYPDGPRKDIFLFEEELRALMPQRYQYKPMKLKILGLSEQQVNVEDFNMISKTFRNNLGHMMFDSMIADVADIPTDTSPVRVLFRRITRIRIYHEQFVNGLEFYFDSGSAVFGGRGGSQSDFNFEPGEKLVGFSVRSNTSVDGIQLITSLKRRFSFNFLLNSVFQF